MNANITIKRATTADLELLKQLGEKTFFDTFTGTCTEDDMQVTLDLFFDINTMRAELQDPNDYFFIAFENEKAVAYYRMKNGEAPPFEIQNDKKAIELKRIYMLQSHHGSGIAATLMNHAHQLAAQLYYDLVYLSVWENNFRAQNFYKKMGYTDTGFKNDFPLGETPQTDFWYIKNL